MTAPKKLADASEPSLDQRLQRLETIVAELEGGGVVLEEAIERYQEGVLLLKECRTVLSGYRRRVEELSQSAEESLRAYAGDPDANEDEPSTRADAATRTDGGTRTDSGRSETSRKGKS